MTEKVQLPHITTTLQVLTLLTLVTGLGVVTFTPAENAKTIRAQGDIQRELQLSLTRMAGVQAGNVDDIREIKDDLRTLETRLRMLEISRIPE